MRSLLQLTANVNVADVEGIVYLASPKPTFGTKLARRMIGRARKLFPRAGVIAAGDLFTSNEDWLKRWPFTLGAFAGLAFFSEADGTVGLGVCKEVADAQALDLPVVFLDDEGGVFDAFDLVPHDARSARRFARVVAG